MGMISHMQNSVPISIDQIKFRDSELEAHQSAAINSDVQQKNQTTKQPSLSDDSLKILRLIWNVY